MGLSVSQWFAQLNYDQIIDMVIVTLAALACITIHEASHGYAAYRLGDPTAKRMGRLSLNPLRHLDPIGLLCMALAHFGWAKPVPIDPRYFKNFRRDTAITALAGPVSNVLLTIIALFLYGIGSWAGIYWNLPGIWDSFLFFLYYTAVLSAGLAVFNLLPLPPLDGSKVLLSILPQRYYRLVLRYERYGFIVLAGLLYLGILDGPLQFLRSGLLGFLWPVCEVPYKYLISLL